MIPLATYRLQFHEGFRFAHAAGLAPYFARLGISHVDASNGAGNPYTRAGSTSTGSRTARDDPAVQQAVDVAVSRLNHDPARLDALIRDPHWRAD
jgi:maltooligosyltrehalose synthase